MTEFKPAIPQLVPAPGLAGAADSAAPPVAPAPPAHGPAPVEGTPPPGAPHVPHYAAPKRIVTSRQLVGAPSTSPPPHLTPERPAALPQAKREYAWQRNRALGKRF